MWHICDESLSDPKSLKFFNVGCVETQADVGVSCGLYVSYWFYWSLSDSWLLLLVNCGVVSVVVTVFEQNKTTINIRLNIEIVLCKAMFLPLTVY